MTNLSQWFELAEQKPWEVGVYRVELSMRNKPDLRTTSEWFAYWDGYKFVSFRLSPDESFRNRNGSLSQDLCNIKWRGLSTNPEVRKKPANKRKTMYVVQALWASGLYKAEGSYKSHANAKKHLARLESNKSCDDAWIEKIRFRTPE